LLGLPLTSALGCIERGTSTAFNCYPRSNSTSMGAMAAAGIGGALILGPIGALAGLLGPGHSSEMQVLVTMRTEDRA
jgi:hypothetical protein